MPSDPFHRFPKGLRLYGIAGLTQEGRSVRSWFNLPGWAKRSYGVGERVRRAGRLMVRSTGELLEAAYSVSFVPSGLQIRQLRELAPRFHDGAFSSWPGAMTPRTLDAKEAAHLLRIHPQTLMARARAGIIPGYRVGKAWVFVDSLLIEYLVAHRFRVCL